MKYIIVPIYRFIGLILAYALAYPFLFVASMVFALWDFSFKEKFKEFNLMDFEEQQYVKEGETYWYYKNPYDWFIKNKKYKVKEKEASMFDDL